MPAWNDLTQLYYVQLWMQLQVRFDLWHAYRKAKPNKRVLAGEPFEPVQR